MPRRGAPGRMEEKYRQARDVWWRLHFRLQEDARRGLALAERGEAVQAIRFKAGMYNRRVCIAAGA